MKQRMVTASTQYTPEERRLVELAMARFGYTSISRFLHAASMHMAGHRRSVIRPIGRRVISGEGGTSGRAGSRQGAPHGLGEQGNTERGEGDANG